MGLSGLAEYMYVYALGVYLLPLKARRGRRDPPELEFGTIVSHLSGAGTEPRLSRRAASAFIY